MKLDQGELTEIIKGCKKQDRASQQKVYEMFYGKMLPLCNRYAKNSEEAKDVLQNGFIKVFEKIDKYSFDGSFGGWVRRLIVNTAIDHYRKHKNEYLIEDESRIADELGISLGTSKSNLAKAKANVKKILMKKLKK